MSFTLEMQDQHVQTTDPSGPADTKTKDRTIWVGAVGLVLAVACLAAGGLLRNDANFADDYVARQLGEQRITFKATDALNDAERQTPCLVAYAGTPLTTGAQAECYANNFIGQHLKSVANGKTFSEMREVQNGIRADIAKAQAAGDSAAAADLQRQLGEVTGKRQTLFEGETVRGLLLTSFGFSTLGEKAHLGANVANSAGGALLLLSLAVVGRAVVRRSRTS
jgi:hypothetical protein